MTQLAPFPIFQMKEVRTNEETVHHNYGVVDPWGRTLGCVVKTWEAAFVVKEDVGTYSFQRDKYTLESAERHVAERTARGPFHLYMQATRNGERYGASHGWGGKQFHTVEERDAAIAKYLKQARKTAEKSVIKQAAARAARQAAKGR